MITSLNIFSVIIFIAFILYNVCLCLEVGDECTIRTTEESGICKISQNCPSAEEQARKGVLPTICGFYQLTTPIVCCQNNNFNARPEPNDHALFPTDEGAISFPNETPTFHENSFPTVSSRKSEEKCMEYSKSISVTVLALPLVTDAEVTSRDVEKCEYNSVALIVGGAPALAREFPFMAALGFLTEGAGISWKCGATLISDRFVVTAAHCTFSRDLDEPKIIRLGELDLSRTGESEHKDYNIKNIIVHPDYNYPKKYHDIALVESEVKITFTKYIRPACLHTKRNIGQDTGIATGWGKTEFGSDNSDRLMKVSLNIYDNKECIRTYGINKNLPQGITSKMLCAGELKGGRDTCQGDSGGPLLITEKDNQCKFYIIGVTSFGKSCAQIETPAVYTRISEYIKWIEDTIW